MGKRLAILRDDTQRCTLACRQRLGFFQLQFLLAAKFKSVRKVILAGFTVGEGQLPLITRRIQAKVVGFPSLIRTIHQDFLSAFKGQLVGTAVVGKGNGDRTNQRKQDKQPHTGNARVNIAPGIGFTVSENIQASRA